jgi:hypothetical protein
MSINIIPAQAVSLSPSAFSVTATTTGNIYKATLTLEPAVYSITCTSSTNATVEFYSSTNARITQATTVTGSVNVNLASTASSVGVYINTGSNIVVTISKVSSALTGTAVSGTLDTITSTGTYAGTSTSGYAYVVVVGGGGGAGGRSNSYNADAGASGGVASGYEQLTGSVSVTIGAGGASSTGTAIDNGIVGDSGGASTFGNTTANGGGGGVFAGIRSTPGTPGGGAGGGNTAGDPSTVAAYSWVQSGTTGGGNGYNVNTAGVGSGIGTGGTPNTAATGYGSGGGGRTGTSNTSKPGMPGVVYVLKF